MQGFEYLKLTYDPGFVLTKTKDNLKPESGFDQEV